MTLNEFFISPVRNAWVDLDVPASLYLRKAHRLIDGRMQFTLDLATVEVSEECQGTGVFTRLLDLLEKHTVDGSFDALYVENILEPRLVPFLERRGYQRTPESGLIPCLFKRKNDFMSLPRPDVKRPKC
jgi:GNAT superfamily N-acetyltransferase